MFCTKCGAQNPDTSVRCEKCGEVLPAPVAQQAEAAQIGGAAPNNFAANLPPVNNYLVPAIISTLCCCLPFGVVSIIYAAQVNTKLTAGDYPGAVESSKKAKFWFMLALVLGFIANGIAVALQVMVAVANNH